MSSPRAQVLFGPVGSPPAGELVYTDGSSWSDVLNAPGAATFVIPANQPSATAENLAAGRTALYVVNDNVPVWSGMLWKRPRNPGDNTITLIAAGWHSYFRHRRFRTDKTWTAVEQLDIAREVIDHAQAVSAGNVGITTTDTNTSGVTRDRTYLGRERKPYGETLEQLAAVRNGFDFRYDTHRNSAGDIEVAFRTSYPATGRPTNLVFEDGSNCEFVRLESSAERLANHTTATGAGEETQMLIATAEDAASLNSYPLLEDVAAYVDVTVQATLDDHVNRDLARNLNPAEYFTIKLDPGADPGLGSFVIGDQARAVYSDPFETIDQTVRILQIKVEIGDTDQVTLKLGPLDPVHAPDIGTDRRETDRRLGQLERARRNTP